MKFQPIASRIAWLAVFLACSALAQTDSPGSAAAIAASRWDGAGRAARDKKDYATAIVDYQKAIEIDSRYASAWIDLGTAYLDLKQYQQANETFRKYLTLPDKPDEQVALLLVGITYEQLNQYPEAAEAFRSLLRVTSERGMTFKARYELGHSLCLSGQYAAAVDELRQAIQVETQACDAVGACADSEAARTYLGLSYYRLKRYPEALQAFEEASRLKPDDIDTSYFKGMTYVRMGQKQNALAEYQKLLPVDNDKKDATDLYNEINKMGGAAPSQPTPATSDAAALAEECRKNANIGDNAKTIEICKRAVEANPGDSEAWSNLGGALFVVKRHAEAAQAFQQVVRLNPNDAHAQYGVGAAFVETREFDKAVSYLRQAVRLDADDANQWYDLGHALFEIKQYASAEQALEQADRLQPDDHSTQYWLGRTYVRIGKKAEALARYQKLAGANADADKKMAQQLYAEINQMSDAPSGSQPAR